MLPRLITRSLSVRFSSQLIVGRKEVVGQDIIGRMPVLKLPSEAVMTGQWRWFKYQPVG
jgi:hypothetical protein